MRTSAVTIRLEALPTASTPELPEMDELFHRPPVPVHLASGDGTDFPLLPRFPDPDWRELTDEQQAILAPFAPEWNTWTVAEKHAWLTFAERFPQLPEDRRRRASRRVFEWANMSLAERRMARANYRDARRHPPSQRAREWERYQAIPEAERNSLRRADPNRDISAARRSNGHSGLARDISNPIPGLMPPGAPPAFAPRHRTLPTQAPPPGAPPAMTYSPDGPGAPPANLAPAQQLPPPEPAHLDQR